jgi:hypothetical protein
MIKRRSHGEVALARAHGLFNVAGGLWPLLHMRSFEVVLGSKTDRWLVRTVAGLLITNGLVQVGVPDTAAGLAQARRIGLGTALTLATIDLVYVPCGRISRLYLVDAALEVGWIIAWSVSLARAVGCGEAGQGVDQG